MNHRGSLGTNVYSPISQSPVTPPPQFRMDNENSLMALVNTKQSADQLSDDEEPSSATDHDRNALVEFNRKKAQHEKFQYVVKIKGQGLDVRAAN